MAEKKDAQESHGAHCGVLVEATKFPNHYGLVGRKVGEQFHLRQPEHFSPRWMKVISDPKKLISEEAQIVPKGEIAARPAGSPKKEKKGEGNGDKSGKGGRGSSKKGGAQDGAGDQTGGSAGNGGDAQT